jgi:hypothetical protein
MTPSSAAQRGNEQAGAQFNTDRTHPGRWTITFSNPPIEALHMKTPASAWCPSRRRNDAQPPRWEYPSGAWVLSLGGDEDVRCARS